MQPKMFRQRSTKLVTVCIFNRQREDYVLVLGIIPSLKSVNLCTTGFWSDILKDDSGQLSIGRFSAALIYIF